MCDVLQDAVGKFCFPGELLALSLTCREMYDRFGPDVPHDVPRCILMTDSTSHHWFKQTPRGYIDCRFHYRRDRCESYREMLVENVFEDIDRGVMDHVDMCLLTAALADEGRPRVIPWRFMWHDEKRLFSYALMECCVPLFERIEMACTTTADRVMAQMLVLSSILEIEAEDQDFVFMVSRQRSDVIDWVVRVADYYGYPVVVYDLRSLKRRRIV